jgi:hypothetical protein
MYVTIVNADWFGFSEYIKDKEVVEPVAGYFDTFSNAVDLFRQSGLRVVHYRPLGSAIASDVIMDTKSGKLVDAMQTLISLLHPDIARMCKYVCYELVKDKTLLGHDF